MAVKIGSGVGPIVELMSVGVVGMRQDQQLDVELL